MADRDHDSEEREITMEESREREQEAWERVRTAGYENMSKL